jgi:hypothetical protein
MTRWIPAVALLALLQVFLTSLVGPDAAIAKEAESPEVAATAAMMSMKQGDWGAYTHRMHPEALAKAKQIFGAVVHADTSGRVGQLFFGVQSAKAYEAMSDSITFVAFMTNLTKHVPVFAEVIKSAEFNVIGTLPEGKDLVHIVYRTGAKAEEIVITRSAVLSMRRYGSEWRMLLTGNIEGMAARLSQMTGSPH